MLAVLRAMVALGLLAACGAWAGARGSYWLDLAATFTAHAASGACVLALWWLARRRFIAAAVCAGAAGLGLAGLTPGRIMVAPDRAAMTPAPRDDWTVRLLLWNVGPGNGQLEGVRRLILESDADVVSLLEAPAWLIEEFKAGGVWRETWPHYWLPGNASTGFRMVLTKHAQHEPVGLREGAHLVALDGLRQIVLDRPAGAWGFVQVHPLSPRNEERWRDGFERLEDAARGVSTHMVPRGLSVVLAGDLNSTPASARSRFIEERLGVRRAKPLLTPAGTFPASVLDGLGRVRAGVPFPMQVAIDDALLGPGVRLLRWEALPATGSDHRPVLIDLEVPPPSKAVLLPG